MLKKLIVIIPAFNEAECIADTVAALRVKASLFEANNIALLVYVVDDGSTDQTSSMATDAGADKIIRHRKNMGLGAAVRTGLAVARDDGADIVVKFDADLQHDPNDLLSLVSPILDDLADVVYGNRFERIQYRMPFVRRVGNFFFTALMRRLTRWPLKDSQPGIFALNRTYLRVFHIPGNYNYTQQILIDAYHKNMRFTHCPVTFKKRMTGSSFVSLRYPFKVLPQILMVIVGIKPMRLFAPVGLGFIVLSVLIFVLEFIQWLLGHAPKPVMHVNAVLGLALFGTQALFFGVLAELILQSEHRVSQRNCSFHSEES